MLYPSSLEFLAAFFGCLYAGVIPVPAYSPTNRRHLPRLEAIIKDAEARVALTTKSLLTNLSAYQTDADAFLGIPLLATDAMDAKPIEETAVIPPRPSDLAFLQYTSGSTGDPKGVMVTHANLMVNSEDLNLTWGHDESSVMVTWLPLFHDLGLIYGVLQPLYVGFPCYVMSPTAFLKRPMRWLQAISRYRGTHSAAPNFAYELCLARATDKDCGNLDLSSWKMAMNGAEPVRGSTMRRFAEAFQPHGFQPLALTAAYGLAEATLKVAAGRHDQPYATLWADTDALQNHQFLPTPAGQGCTELMACSMAEIDTQITIVNPETCQKLAEGQVGEIWVAGETVCAGYWRRPELTQAVFEATLGCDPGKWLRTGDLGFLYEDQLFITGRMKDLLIVNGQNYYPQDLESTVQEALWELRDSCGAAWSEESAEGTRVYLVQELHRSATRATDFEMLFADMRRLIFEVHGLKLQEIALIRQGSLPKTSSGKIQRRLAAAQFHQGELPILAQWRESQTASAPQDAQAENALTNFLLTQAEACFRMPQSSVSMDQPLADLLPDSIQLADFANRIEAFFALELDPFALLQHFPTLKALHLALLEKPRLKELPSEHAAKPHLTTPTTRPVHAVKTAHPSGGKPFAMTPGQVQMGIAMALGDQAVRAYSESLLLSLSGKLDVPLLQQVLQELVNRHDSLRLCFDLAKFTQQVQPQVEVLLQLLDATRADHSQEEAETQWLASEQAQTLDLAQGPAFQFSLFRKRRSQHLLLLRFHHLIIDGISINTLLGEFCRLYDAMAEGKFPDLLPAKSFWDFANTQGDEAPNPITTGTPGATRLGSPNDFNGQSLQVALPHPCLEALAHLARTRNETLFGILFPASLAFLHAVLGRPSVTVAWPRSLRSKNQAAVVGYGVALDLFASKLDFGLTFQTFTESVRQTWNTAKMPAAQPFPEGATPDNPFSQSVDAVVSFAPLQPAPEMEYLDLAYQRPFSGLVKYPLHLEFEKNHGGTLQLRLDYQTAVWHPETVAQLAQSLVAFLSNIAARPQSRLADLAAEVLSPPQTKPLQAVDEALERVPIEHFLRQVALRPQAPAAVFNDLSVCYATLNALANGLAQQLQEWELGPEKTVAVIADVSLEYLVSLLALAKLGACYVPIDPSFPQDRIHFMLEDSQAQLVLVQHSVCLQNVPAGISTVTLPHSSQLPQSDAAPHVRCAPENLAYIMYTSGSTGRPKGVCIPLRAICRLVFNNATLAIQPGERVAHVANPAFDATTYEIWAPLLQGGVVVGIDKETVLQFPAFRQALRQHKITVMFLTTALFNRIVAELPDAFASLRTLLFGGEATDPRVVRALMEGQPPQLLANVYGPTEATTFSASHTICTVPDENRRVPIGQAIDYTRLWVLNDLGQPSFPGLDGGLMIDGPGLARGYLNRPRLTAQAFLPHPCSTLPGERLYKTGDRVRELPNGDLEFLGRGDRQIKLRGFRIELAEIEYAARALPHLVHLLADVVSTPNGEAELVAWVQMAPRQPEDPEPLIAALSQSLPAYMLPNRWVFVDAMPVNAVGKIDRNQLPNPHAVQDHTDLDADETNPLVLALAARFAELLGVPSYGKDQNFFQNGGNSLLAAKAVGLLRQCYPSPLTLSIFYSQATPYRLAQWLEANGKNDSLEEVSNLARGTGMGPFPLSPSQNGMWLVQKLNQRATPYAMPLRLRFPSHPGAASIRDMLETLAERHEVLRTRFEEHEGVALQWIDSQPRLNLDIHDLTSTGDGWQQVLEERIREAACRPVSLKASHLMRAVAFALPNGELDLLLVLHHMVADGHSVQVLVAECQVLFDRQALPPKPAIRYVDWVQHCRSAEQGQEFREMLDWWKTLLTRKKFTTALPTDFPRPPSADFKGTSLTKPLPSDLVERVRQFAKREGVTDYTVYLASFFALLHHATQSTQLAIGAPYANRKNPQTQDVVGCFVNTLVLTADLESAPTFRSLLQQVAQTTLAAWDRGEVPFETLVAHLNPQRDASRNAFFQVLFDYHPSMNLSQGASLKSALIDTGSAFCDLAFSVMGNGSEQLLRAEFATALFKPQTLAKLMDRYQMLLEALLAFPDQPFSQQTLFSPVEQRLADILSDALPAETVTFQTPWFLLLERDGLRRAVLDRVNREFNTCLTLEDTARFTRFETFADLITASMPQKENAMRPMSPKSSLRKASSASGAVAVIGMAGRFTGGQDLEEFWSDVLAKRDRITHFTEDQLREAGIPADVLADPNYVRAKGMLRDVALFDAEFFNIPPREAGIIDPQQRLFLENAWHALENAGYDPAQYGGRVGVYAGRSPNYYFNENLIGNPAIATVDSMKVDFGNFSDFVASKVSYALDLKGPAVNVQASCATGLAAIAKAYFSLLSHQCDLAISGAVSVLFPHVSGYGYQEGSILSPDGACRAFDASSKGMVIGEGVGAVVLKRLEDALADGDTIRAVIRGAAINNDGSDKVGFTAPGVRGQYEVIRAALAQAGIHARDVGFVEAHGTGTLVGDPIEVAALTQAFRDDTQDAQFCGLGSVKPNIGHCDSASGVSGFIAAVKCLEDKLIHPTHHFETANPKLELPKSPFFVAKTPTPWNVAPGKRRIAAVSSFGVGGTNAHILIEEAPEQVATEPGRAQRLLCLSARSAAALEAQTQNLAQALEQNPNLQLDDLAYTLAVGRKPMEHRRVFTANSTEEALRLLAKPQGKGVFTRACPRQGQTLAFMFSGQGSQYPNMAKGLYESEALFRETVDTCCEQLKPFMGMDLRELLYPEILTEADTEKLNQTRYTQPALFIIEYAMAQLWMSWGLIPHMMVGHSMGEYAAATLAGVLSLEDALILVAERGRLTQSLEGGAMVTVSLPAEEVEPLLTPTISIGVINSAANCVVSGNVDAVEALEAILTEKGVDFRRLRISGAFHSVTMEPVREDFLKAVRKAKLKAPKLPYISCLTGDWITPEQATDPVYWWEQMKGTVYFAKGIAKVMEQPDLVLLEVGPGRTLTTLTRQQLNRENPAVLLTSIRHPKEDQTDLTFALETLGRLWMHGVNVTWARFYQGQQRRRIPLPGYPFDRKHYWADRDRDDSQDQEQPKLRKNPDLREWTYAPTWKRTPLTTVADAEARQTWVVFHHPQGIGKPLVSALRQRGDAVISVKPGAGFVELDEESFTLAPDQAGDYETLFEILGERDEVPTRLVHLWNHQPEAEQVDERASFEETQQLGFLSLLKMFQGLHAMRSSADMQITIVANGFSEVTGLEYLDPNKATLLAYTRVLSQEHPHLRCRLLDVPFPKKVEDMQRMVRNLRQELVAPDAHPVVAYRGVYRYAESFARAGLPEVPESAAPFKKGGVYFVTGGLGYLGFELGALLAERYQAKLALVGRHPLPARDQWETWLEEHRGQDDKTSWKIQQMQRLEELGAKVLTLVADAADKSAMENALAATEAHFGKINGVLHAAGVTDESHYYPIKQTSDANAAFHFAPKVQGMQNLAELLACREPEFVLCFSSIASILGGLGFVCYSAANSYLDAYAHLLNRTSPFPWVSVNWDGWLVGILEEEAAQSAEDSLLALAMTMPEGLEITERILAGGGYSQIAVSTGDLEYRIQRWVHLHSLEPEAESGEETTTHSQKHDRPQLSNAYTAPTNAFEEAISGIWQELLGVSQVGIHDNFFELGGDSLLAVHLSSRIHKNLSVEVPGGSLLAAQTPAEQAELVISRLAEQASPELLADLAT